MASNFVNNLLLAFFIILTYQLPAQNTWNNYQSYYYADGEAYYWVVDSTSVNIIVKNMVNYHRIIEEDILTKNAPVEAQTSDVQEHDLNYELSLYPNPAQSEMTVSSNNPAVKIVQMDVYDVTGRKVYQQAGSQSYGTLKLNGLAQGIYILKVWTDKGDMVVKKIVKQ